jgi:hypothetical protein
MSKIAIVSVMVVVLFLSPLAPVAQAWKKGNQPPAVEFNAPLMTWLRQQPEYDKDKTQWFLVDRHWTGPPFHMKPALVVSWSGKPAEMALVYRSKQNTYAIDIYNPVEYYSLDDGKIIKLQGPQYGTTWGDDEADIKGITIGNIRWYVVDGKLMDISKVDLNIRLPQFDVKTITTKQRCEWHNVICWVTNGITTIGNSISEFFNGFVKVIQNLMEFFSQLFIPGDDNLFLKTFDNLNEYMHKKLGFLMFPVDFVASIIKTLMTVVDSDIKSEWHCTRGLVQPGVCNGLCVPKVFGNSGLCLKFTQLETVFPELWRLIIFTVRFVVVIGLVELMRIKYYSIVRS